MKKRVLPLLLSLVLLIGALSPAASAAGAVSGKCGPGAYWSLSGTTLRIYGTGATDDFTSGGSSPVPWQAYQGSLTSAVVEPGITRLGNNAFRGAQSLTSVTVADSVTSFGNSCFQETNITSFTFPRGTRELGKRMFADCYYLRSLDIPEGVTSIPIEFTHGCYSLTDIRIPASVTEVSLNAFSGDNLIIRFAGHLPKFAETNFIGTVVRRFASEGGYVEEFLPYLESLQVGANSGIGISGTYMDVTSGSASLSLDLPYRDGHWLLLTGGQDTYQAHVQGGSSGKRVEWHTYDPSVATVDADGSIRAVGWGTTLVYAIVTDGADRALLVGSVSVARNGDLTALLPTSLAPDFPTRITSESDPVSYGGQYTYQMAKFVERDTSNADYREIKALVDSLTAGCSTQLEKARAIMLWLSGSFDQSYSIPIGTYIDQIYSVYHSRNTQCMGFTMLNGLMLYMAGIPSAWVDGETVQGTHAWNLALCDGRWVNIDATWGEFDFPSSDPDHGMVTDISFGDGDGCYVLASPEGVSLAGIGWHVLHKEGIASFTVPSYVRSISPDAFDGASDLRSVTIPASVRRVAPDQFTDRSLSLTDIYYAGTSAQWAAVTGASSASAGTSAALHFASGSVDVSRMTDMSAGSYYYRGVRWALERGLTQPVSASRYGADDICPRWEIVSALWRAMGSPAPSRTSSPFTDVSPSAPYYSAVLWAYEAGVTQGTGGGRFGPNDQVNREQSVTFLYRAAGEPALAGARHQFVDVPEGSYTKAISWASERCDPPITLGTGSNRLGPVFSPKTPVTRGMMMTFLYRWLVENAGR